MTRHIYFEKDVKQSLSSHFLSTELQCQCKYKSCVEQKISQDLLDKLEIVRNKYGKPLKITSAYRCEKHQAYLRKSGIQTAVNKSQHELGNAVDVRPLGMSEDNMDELFELLETEFQAIGIAKNFYHVDVRSDKTRRWDYV